MDGIERGQLSVMPIHAVTEVYGEAGLRMLFEIESENFPEGERATLLRAERVASRLHAGDKRVREPYVNHLLRVAIRIIQHYQVRDAEVVVAALLHDAVEDHPRDLADLAGDAERAAGERNAALTMLARAFTPRVANLIASVTNPDYDPERDRGEQYREHVVESLEVDPWARVIKLSDFTDNGVGIIHTTGPNRTARRHTAGRRGEGAHSQAARPRGRAIPSHPRGPRVGCPAGWVQDLRIKDPNAGWARHSGRPRGRRSR
jgi:hypothetical protein